MAFILGKFTSRLKREDIPEARQVVESTFTPFCEPSRGEEIVSGKSGKSALLPIHNLQGASKICAKSAKSAKSQSEARVEALTRN